MKLAGVRWDYDHEWEEWDGYIGRIKIAHIEKWGADVYFCESIIAHKSSHFNIPQEAQSWAITQVTGFINAVQEED